MDYKGMTVNERLYVSEKMDEFDKAVAEKDVKKIISILRSVELGDENIKAILESNDLKMNN